MIPIIIKFIVLPIMVILMLYAIVITFRDIKKIIEGYEDI